MASPADIIMWAEKNRGFKYDFGGELHGASPGDCDCSEMVEYACRNAGVPITDGSWLQFQACDKAGLRIPFSQARNTPGALIFKSRSTAYPPPDGRDGGIYHVAIVKGPNQTIEACCKNGDVIRNMTIDGRSWYRFGGLIPGVRYETPTPPPPPSSGTVTFPAAGGTVTVRLLRKTSPMMQGRDVRQMQAMLSEWAIGVTHDGVFGPATDSAVRKFQKARGLMVDGQCGAKTWESLCGG